MGKPFDVETTDQFDPLELQTNLNKAFGLWQQFLLRATGAALKATEQQGRQHPEDHGGRQVRCRLPGGRGAHRQASDDPGRRRSENHRRHLAAAQHGR